MTDPQDQPMSLPGGHRAPPIDDRPRSPLALWALVASFVVGFASNFVWYLIFLAVLLAAYAVKSIRPDKARGHGMAIVALILSLLFGACSYFNTQYVRRTARTLATGVLRGLATDEPRDKVQRWLSSDADVDAVLDRYEEVVASFGPYLDELVEPSPLLGLVPFIGEPSGLDEIAPKVGDPKPTGHRQAYWAEARFRDGTVFVEFTLVGEGMMGAAKAQAELQEKGVAKILADVRFYRPPPKK